MNWLSQSLLLAVCVAMSPGFPDCVPLRENSTPKEQIFEVECFMRPKLFASQMSVACVGDSITAGAHSSGPSMTYPAQLQLLLGDSFVVTNLGASGATLQKNGDSPYWQRPQYQTLIANKWDIVIIMLGTNDAKDKGSGGPPNWLHDCEGRDPLANCTFADDYASLIAVVRGLGNPSVSIMIPPPLMQAGSIGANQTVINTVFPTIVPLIASANKLPFPADVYGGMGGVTDWQNKFPQSCALESPWPYCKYWCDAQSCDQCHPNDDGYKLLANIVYNYTQKL